MCFLLSLFYSFSFIRLFFFFLSLFPSFPFSPLSLVCFVFYFLYFHYSVDRVANKRICFSYRFFPLFYSDRLFSFKVPFLFTSLKVYFLFGLLYSISFVYLPLMSSSSFTSMHNLVFRCCGDCLKMIEATHFH